VNRELSTLSHMLRRMAEWKWISPDAVPKITKGPEPRKQIVVLTPEHQQALIRGAVADQDPLTWLFVAFGLNTGMRHSEILRVRWDQIEFEQRRIYIAKAKAGQREQPITAALAALLAKERQQREEADGFVFSVTRRDGKRGHRLTMTRQFERAVKRAGLEPRKVTPHVMRHTAITQLVKAGVDLPTIQRISGHKTLAMVMRYVHLSGEHIDNAIAAIETPLPDAITPELHSKVATATRLHA
jgi:integrase